MFGLAGDHVLAARECRPQIQAAPLISAAQMPYNQGLKIERLVLVLSSISPLFLIWAIRGSSVVPDLLFVSTCLALAVLPNLFLRYRITRAVQKKQQREMVVGAWDDHREHLLVYLFAMLLPFYAADPSDWREFASIGAALGFIVFLFWHLNLHYMNFFFAVFNYRVYTIHPPSTGNPFSGRTAWVLITGRTELADGATLTLYRLSDTVYFEPKR
jgi:hypothetical protein